MLFQLPPYVYPTRGSFGYLKWAAAQLPDFQLAVEFRNGRWLDEEHRDETLTSWTGTTSHMSAVDEPQGFKSLGAAGGGGDLRVAEVRFHGRNAENWEKKGITAAERFRYDYERPRVGGVGASVREMLA